jgi:hypothetical protein
MQEYCHPDLPEPSTYERGRKKVDYQICSNFLASYTTKAGFEQYLTSDHQAAYIDVNIKAFLQGVPSQMTPTTQRILKSGHCKTVRKFQEHVFKQSTAHQINRRVKTLKYLRNNGAPFYKDEPFVQKLD